MKKKILCFCLSLLSLLLCLTPLAAAEGSGIDSRTILNELNTLSIGEEDFSEEDYPENRMDHNFYLITAAEREFQSYDSSPDFALDLYIYNPSCYILKNSKNNAVTIGVGVDDSELQYRFYGLKILTYSADWRFVKVTIADTVYPAKKQDLWSTQRSGFGRLYSIGTIRFSVGGVLKTSNVGKLYVFSGIGENLTCREDELETIKTRLYSSTWRGSNTSDAYHYNQIDTVYFAISNRFFEKYGELYKLRATFDKYHSTPMIITNSESLNNRTEVINAMLAGETKSGDNVLGYDYVYMSPTGRAFIGWAWGNKHSPVILPNMDGVTSFDGPEQSVGYYFYKPYYIASINDSVPVLRPVVSSSELQQYIRNRSDGSSTEVNESLYDSFQQAVEVDYGIRDQYLVSTAQYEMRNWFARLFLDDYKQISTGSENINKIELVNQPSLWTNSSDSAISAMLHIGEQDANEFRSVCAEYGDGYKIVVLHFDQSNYFCRYLDYIYPALEESANDGIGAWVVQQTFYYNVQVISATFHNQGEERTIPVTSNVVNVVGGADVSGTVTDPITQLGNEIKDKLGKFPNLDDAKKALKTLLWILLALLLLILLIPVLRLIPAIWRIVSAPAKWANKLYKKQKNREKGKKETRK